MNSWNNWGGLGQLFQGVGNAASGIYQGAQNLVPAIGNQFTNLGDWASSWGKVDPQTISPVGVQGLNLPAATDANSGMFSMDSFLGTEGKGGWGAPAFGALQSMGNWYTGQQATKLAKEQFAFNKAMAEKNLLNQTKSLNTAMQDRQNARRGASSSYQDTASYMNENQL